MDAREVIANAGFYRGRMRVGPIGAPIGFVVAAVGLVLKLNGMQSDEVSGLLIGIGILFGGDMLVPALAAWWLGRVHLRRP